MMSPTPSSGARKLGPKAEERNELLITPNNSEPFSSRLFLRPLFFLFSRRPSASLPSSLPPVSWVAALTPILFSFHLVRLSYSVT